MQDPGSKSALGTEVLETFKQQLLHGFLIAPRLDQPPQAKF